MRHAFQGALGAMALAASAILPSTAAAYTLYSQDGNQLNADLLAVFGVMDSHDRYDGVSGAARWQEGFAKYGLSGHTERWGGSTYGALSLVSSATWGDGDAGGVSNGSERHTSLEEGSLGWRSGGLLPALGQDGLDVSVGRQVVAVGRGFLINDDGLNAGKSLGGGGLDRGGAYYIGARHAFANTAVLKLGDAQGLHGSAMWLRSDNKAQADTRLAVGTLDYSSAPGTVGLAYIRGLGVDARYASPAQAQRKGMNVYSLHAEGSAGLPDTELAAELARQEKDAGTDTAWYLQASHEFKALPGGPKLSYRFTRYSGNWDALFTGGYLGWLQGEVASNYAGPFNSNTRIHRITLSAKPLESLTVGALFHDFRTLSQRQTLNLDGRELDLYAEWVAGEHLTVSPLIGLYRPGADASRGGVQNRAGTNLYAQLLLIVPF